MKTLLRDIPKRFDEYKLLSLESMTLIRDHLYELYISVCNYTKADSKQRDYLFKMFQNYYNDQLRLMTDNIGNSQWSFPEELSEEDVEDIFMKNPKKSWIEKLKALFN